MISFCFLLFTDLHYVVQQIKWCSICCFVVLWFWKTKTKIKTKLLFFKISTFWKETYTKMFISTIPNHKVNNNCSLDFLDNVTDLLSNCPCPSCYPLLLLLSYVRRGAAGAHFFSLSVSLWFFILRPSLSWVGCVPRGS